MAMWVDAVLMHLTVLSHMDPQINQAQPDVADRRDGEGGAVGREPRAAEAQGQEAQGRCRSDLRRREFLRSTDASQTSLGHRRLGMIQDEVVLALLKERARQSGFNNGINRRRSCGSDNDEIEHGITTPCASASPVPCGLHDLRERFAGK